MEQQFLFTLQTETETNCPFHRGQHVDPLSQSCGYSCNQSGGVVTPFFQFPGWSLFVNDVDDE